MARHNRDIIVIGASAGGVDALQKLVARLPRDLPASIFIVLHLTAGAKSALPAILSRAGPLPAVEATSDAPIKPGHIYVAPPDRHLFVERDRMLVLHGPKENRARPAINPLFRSAARSYGERVVGVILTGLLDDGTSGLWAVQRCGGTTILQSDAAFSNMPDAAAEYVTPDYRIPLAEIGPLLARLASETIEVPDRSETPPLIRMEDDAMQMKTIATNLDKWGERTALTCPDCGGALWRITEGSEHYRCHTGHAYSGKSLSVEIDAVLESSLWSALRALEQSAILDGQLAARAAEHQLDIAAQAHRANESAKLEQAEQLRSFIAQLGSRPPAEVKKG